MCDGLRKLIAMCYFLVAFPVLGLSANVYFEVGPNTSRATNAAACSAQGGSLVDVDSANITKVRNAITRNPSKVLINNRATARNFVRPNRQKCASETTWPEPTKSIFLENATGSYCFSDADDNYVFSAYAICQKPECTVNSCAAGTTCNSVSGWCVSETERLALYKNDTAATFKLMKIQTPVGPRYAALVLCTDKNASKVHVQTSIGQGCIRRCVDTSPVTGACN